MSNLATFDLTVLRQRLSPERIDPYEKTATNLPAALALYEWNLSLSSAFHGLLHGVEVLRQLERDREDAHQVVAAICGDSSVWLHRISAVPGALSARP